MLIGTDAEAAALRKAQTKAQKPLRPQHWLQYTTEIKKLL